MTTKSTGESSLHSHNYLQDPQHLRNRFLNFNICIQAPPEETWPRLLEKSRLSVQTPCKQPRRKQHSQITRTDACLTWAWKNVTWMYQQGTRLNRNRESSDMNRPSRVECEISIERPLLSAKSSAAFVNKLLVSFLQQRILGRTQLESSVCLYLGQKSRSAEFNEVIFKMWQLKDEQCEGTYHPDYCPPTHFCYNSIICSNDPVPVWKLAGVECVDLARCRIQQTHAHWVGKPVTVIEFFHSW